jgi:hypothetical protein
MFVTQVPQFTRFCWARLSSTRSAAQQGVQADDLEVSLGFVVSLPAAA